MVCVIAHAAISPCGCFTGVSLILDGCPHPTAAKGMLAFGRKPSLLAQSSQPAFKLNVQIRHDSARED